MKTRKLFRLLLTTAMILALITGCNTTPSPSPSASASTAPSASAEPSPSAEPSAPAAEEREHVTIRQTMYGVVLDNIPDGFTDPIREAIEAATNTSIEFETYPGETYLEQMELNLMGGTAPDISMNYAQQDISNRWATQGVVTDIGAIINANPERYPILHKIINSPEYKMFNDYYYGDPDTTYSLLALQADPGYAWISGDLTYNKGVLTAAGYADPPKTIADFMAYGKAVAALGEGKFGWFPRNNKLENLGYINDAIALPMGTTIIAPDGDPWSGMIRNADGTWALGTTSDMSKEAVKTLHQMYQDGTLPAALGSMPDFDETKDKWANDEIGAVTYAVTSPAAYQDMLTDYKKGNPDATLEDVVIGPRLTSDSGNVAKQYGTPFWASWNYFIPTSCAYPERVLDLIEFIGSSAGQNLVFRGIEGEFYTPDGSGGVASFNKDAWDKLTEVYIQAKDRCSHPMFNNLFTGRGCQVDWENASNWYEASKQIIDYTNIIAGGETPEYTYAKPLTDANRKNTFVELPTYYSIIAFSEELQAIRTQLKQITTEYVPAFIVGQKDIDTEWVNYVAAYEAAGVQQIVDALNTQVGEAEAKFKSYTGR